MVGVSGKLMKNDIVVRNKGFFYEIFIMLKLWFLQEIREITEIKNCLILSINFIKKYLNLKLKYNQAIYFFFLGFLKSSAYLDDVNIFERALEISYSKNG